MTLTDSTPHPSGVVATAPSTVAVPEARDATPNADRRPGHLFPLPAQTDGGDVRNAPFAPVRAVDHLSIAHHPLFVSGPSGGEAA